MGNGTPRSREGDGLRLAQVPRLEVDGNGTANDLLLAGAGVDANHSCRE